MSNTIFKKKLTNGLTIILKESHHAPVTSFWVWYRVGSRNERSGLTGVSHWVEHMMFKGSSQFPAGSLDRLIAREGGHFNAFTSQDYTAYYELMPADRIDLALQIEADRMTTALFDKEEVESERTVIISERKMYANNPLFELQEELQAAAFRVHPYHHEIIGDEVDLQTMSREDLYHHYKLYYTPNNATIIVVGDFDQQEMLAKIEHRLAELPAGPEIPPVLRTEPIQKGERRVKVEGPGQTAYLVFSYRAPAANDPDFLPLALLNAAFTGGSSLGSFAGGGSNKSSRLYKALVKSRLATATIGNLSPSIDPFLYSILAITAPGESLSTVEEALEKALMDLEENPITEEELAKAIKRTRAQFIQAGESVSGQGQMIGLSEMLCGEYDWAEKALQQFEKITVADLQRVREKYLQPRNRTAGWYVPQQ